MVNLTKHRIIDHQDPEYFDETMTRINSLYGLKDLLDYWKVDKTWTILEIGSYAGVSSELFSNYAKKVYCVDAWEEYIQPLDRAIMVKQEFDKVKLLNSNVIEVKLWSKDASKFFLNHSLDLIYIDGDHEEESIRNDIVYWLLKLKLGGVLSGHDYWVDSVRNIVNSIFGKDNIKYFDDSSWSVKINESHINMFRYL